MLEDSMDCTAVKYKKILGFTKANLTHIDHDDAIIALVYKVSQPHERPFILKVCTGDKDYYRELFFLNFLKDILPIPHIVKTIDPMHNLKGAILMEYIKGALLQDKDWTNSLAWEIGAKLATLHSHSIGGYGNPTNSQGLTTKPYEYFREKFQEELAECSDHLPGDMIKNCERYFNVHHHLLSSVDGPCLIHRDFRPGNMIVKNGSLMGIIDWSSGRSGFAEQDFCSMEHHKKWPTNPEHKQTLLNGYSSIRPIPNFNAIMPLLRLGQALAVIGFTVKSGTWSSKNQKIYQYNRQFLEQFFG